jgi:argininosuccinate lyase
MKAKSKPWGGRFSVRTHDLAERFTASIPFDQRLARHDIEGSIAHCRALAEAKVMTKEEAESMIQALKEVGREISSSRLEFSLEQEDIHMAIEQRLIEKVGDLGGKLQTARSRNDQVALDLRLFLREEIGGIRERVLHLQQALVGIAKKHLDVVMPGYTHLQPAQPVLFSHHLLAYFEMLDRDQARLGDCLERLNVLPLGSGAIAGTNYPVDRQYLARLLGFPEVSRNSLDAVSDRDFAVEFLSAVSMLMMHLSRLSEELILWSSDAFGFISLPDAFCTGSSLMPQKKNPDVPELIRAKSGRVYGHLVGLLTLLKGLPLAYNRDLQEDKEAIFDAVDTTRICLEVTAELLKGIQLNKKKMEQATQTGFLLATDLADYLVGKGVSFRQAHQTVGRIVSHCLKEGKRLERLSLKELRKFSNRFEKDIKGYLTVERSLNRKNQIGSTARRQVMERIKEIEAG